MNEPPRMLASILGVIGSNSVSKVLLVAVEFFLASRLGAGGYGRYNLVVAVGLVAANLSLLGINYSIIRGVVKARAAGDSAGLRRTIQSAVALVLLNAAIASVALLILAPYFGGNMFADPAVQDLLTFSALILPLEALNQLFGACFQGLRMFRQSVAAVDLVRNLFLFISVPLVLAGLAKLPGVLTLFVSGSIAGCCYAAFVLHRVTGWLTAIRPDIGTALDLLRFSRSLFLCNIFQTVAGRIQVILCGMLLGAEEVGVFALLMRILLVLTFFQSAVNRVSPAEFTRLLESGQIDETRVLYERLSRLLALTIVFVALALFITPDVILRIIGTSYAPFGTALCILLSAQLINVATGPAGQALIYGGYQTTLFWIAFSGAIFQVLVYFLLIPSYHLYGAVIAEASTILTLVSLRQGLLWKHLGISGLSRSFWSFAVVFSVACLGGRTVRSIALPYADVWAQIAGYALLASGALLIRYLSLKGPAATTPGSSEKLVGKPKTRIS
jgi:O-antigen/teichoic acid export membrane protein